MQQPDPVTSPVTRRDPAIVMRLSRLGSFHQSRLSFMRVLLRRTAAEGWRVTRATFDIDARGVGHAVYTAQGPERAYSLICFAHDLPDALRSDRVIAEAWDATFALFDGVPDAQDIDRLSQNVPLQEAGRISERELCLSRANRSVRLWAHMVDALAHGQQPDVQQIEQVGYLMRTTAVYGSGKFGAADRETLADRPELNAPFQAEMLSVWLTRTFVRDLVEHMARMQGGDAAVPLDAGIAGRLGIGNSTGLGMAPFILNHPVLFNNWIIAREEAIARVRALSAASRPEVALFRRVLAGSTQTARLWYSEHPVQQRHLTQLRADLTALTAHVETGALDCPQPWDSLMRWAETALGFEGQEALASLILEPYGALVDGLADCMADPVGDTVRIDGTMSIGTLRAHLAQTYDWALAQDWQTPDATARLWYVSAEKLEPRLAERLDEPLDDYEQPLAPGRDAAALFDEITHWGDATAVAELLLAKPEHRAAVRRAQITLWAPYAEIRDNTIGSDLLPVDMLRCKLSFFGATQFDPRSDRWVRICMYAGAPYPDDLSTENAEYWVYPSVSHRT